MYVQLIDACKDGDLKQVKELIEKGVNVHTYDDYALMYASQYGHLDLVKYLIEQGADINARNDFALRYASQYGHLDVVKYLIEQGAYIHAIEDATLRVAIIHGHLNIVKYLLQDYYKYTGLSNVHCYYQNNRIELFAHYKKMKFHVLLLYRIHDRKIPLELQKIIFNFI